MLPTKVATKLRMRKKRRRKLGAHREKITTTPMKSRPKPTPWRKKQRPSAYNRRNCRK